MEKTKVVLGLIFIGALIVIVLIPVIIVTTSSKKSTENVFNTNSPPFITKKPYDPNLLTEDEKSRINCFLEEQSHFETLTEYQCVNVRGCIYKPSDYEKVIV